MEKLNEIAETLVGLTVKEAQELTVILKDEHGIEPAQNAPAVIQQEQTDKAEDKTEFDVFITEAGGTKLTVIKEVRNLLGLGLKECKELVDSVPSIIKEGISEAEAEDLKVRFEGLGATIQIK